MLPATESQVIFVTRPRTLADRVCSYSLEIGIRTEFGSRFTLGDDVVDLRQPLPWSKEAVDHKNVVFGRVPRLSTWWPVANLDLRFE
jgi:hypothetical protein